MATNGYCQGMKSPNTLSTCKKRKEKTAGVLGGLHKSPIEEGGVATCPEWY